MEEVRRQLEGERDALQRQLDELRSSVEVEHQRYHVK